MVVAKAKIAVAIAVTISWLKQLNTDFNYNFTISLKDRQNLLSHMLHCFLSLIF